MALAATIVVDDTTDELSIGKCTLRGAILAANRDTPVSGCVSGEGDDTIVMPAGTYILDIPGIDENFGETGDLDITSNLVLTGAGAVTTIIDSNSIDRVLHVDPECAGVVVEISGVTIQNGLAPDFPIADYDKASGGGIHNCGSLSLCDVVVSGNSASDWGLGGGIQNNGELIADNVSIIGNNAYRAGGIYTTGTLIFRNSEVTDNYTFGATGQGGGVYNIGYAEIVNATISGNSTTYAGGGLLNGGGDLRLINSTVSNNTSTWSIGGGAYNASSMEVTNSTISGNLAKTSGGGIANKGIMSLDNVTIAYNSATENSGGGIFIYEQGLIDLSNTLLAGNTVSGTSNNCSVPVGSMTSYGYNLTDGTNTCNLDGIGDKTVGNAYLGPLQDNGGPTLTHALLTDSPAIDAGDPAGCKVAGGTRTLLNDQRSFLRPVDADSDGYARCDIGAFEFGASAGPGSDLMVQMWDTPDPVWTGSPLTYNIYVTNEGPEMGEDIIVTVTLPPGVRWISTSTYDGICVGTSTVTCYLDTLFLAESANVAISVEPVNPGTITNLVTVASSKADPVPANNSAACLTTVIENLPVRRLSGSSVLGSYQTLQEAFDNDLHGDRVEAMATDFKENVTINSIVPVFFSGGYNETFSSRIGYSTIVGSLTLQTGTVSVECLVIR